MSRPHRISDYTPTERYHESADNDKIGRFYIEELPDGIIFWIALKLPLKDLFNLCKVNRRIHSLLCNNEYFWQRRFVKDFGEPDCNIISSWKEEYMNKLMNRVWTFGNNQYGQLGLGDHISQDFPTGPLITEDGTQLKAKDISAGCNHTIIISEHHEVYVFGSNWRGQLGLGDTKDRLTPTRIPNLKAKAVSAGDEHTVVIDLEGNVWVFGDNRKGQLGLGEWVTRKNPTRIPDLKAKAVSAGFGHTVIIDLDDNVWVFGDNWEGQLGLGDRKLRKTRTQIPGLKAKAVSAGGSHTVIIDPEGFVWIFGQNSSGQLGLGNGEKPIQTTPVKIPNLKAQAVSAGGFHTMVIAPDYSVWAFGNNNFRQLGLSECANHYIPTQVYLPSATEPLRARAVSANGLHTLVITLDHSVWAFGDDQYSHLFINVTSSCKNPAQIPGIKARAISAGECHSIILA